MGNKYFDGNISNKKIHEDIDNEFINSINYLGKNIDQRMEKLELSDAVTEIFNVLRLSNKYIDETTPWVLAKDETKFDRLETVLYNLLESIRVCGLFLEPIMPTTSNEILRQLNNNEDKLFYIDDNKYILNDPSPLFQRIDKEKIEINM